uniref:Uncharacterized protein n=1 Tax=Arundo donax TaxID=35708 RepID=A0A0A9D940_ARUDO
MLGGRPVFVLFGSSIVQYSFSNGGWGAALADIYARKVPTVHITPFLSIYPAGLVWTGLLA